LDETEQTDYSEDAHCIILATNMPLNKIQSNSRTGSLHNKTLIQCACSLISSKTPAQTDTFTSTKNKPLGIQVLHLLTAHIKLFDGTSLRVKQVGCNTDWSSPTNVAKVNNVWNYISSLVEKIN
jgi:hypothetical protein